MTISRARVLAVVVAAACLLGAGSAGAATTINGIADQATSQYWPIGGQTYVEAMGGKAYHARFILPWNTALRPGSTDWNQMNDWYWHRLRTNKRMLVSFNPWDYCRDFVNRHPGTSQCAPTLPTVAQYAEAISAFRRTWPGVVDYTAWNEPNHSLVGWAIHDGNWGPFQLNPVDNPELAADYYAALHAECRTNYGAGTCTAVAGDFSDGSDAMGTFPTRYRDRVAAHGITPPAWAVHAYSAINRGATAWIDSFFTTIARSTPTWITEVGVKVCDSAMTYPSEADQITAAQRLVNLMAARNPARTYYYHLFGRENAGSCGVNHRWDSGLLYEDGLATHLDTQPRPALDILFPELDGMYWAMRNSNSGGGADRAMVFPGKGIPVPGDWDGDGDDTPGMFDPATGTWYLTNRSYSSQPEAVFQYGNPGNIPVVGDWDGNGRDTIGVFDPGPALWHLRNATSSGPQDIEVGFGLPTDKPIAGDWNGDGIDTPGVWRGATWYLRNSNSSGPADQSFVYGAPEDVKIVGDWNGDGVDTPGVIRGDQWLLRNSNSSAPAEIVFGYGLPTGDRRTAGDWDANGTDTPALAR